jgi:hypothetical protein
MRPRLGPTQISRPKSADDVGVGEELGDLDLGVLLTV